MTGAYPLEWPEGWPRTPEDKRRYSSPFTTTFDRARRQLYDQLRMLGAKNVVISSWLPLRQDGQPRSDHARYRIDDPGVAVYFTLRGRQMVMARDGFASVHDNLRSIGLAIEGLRQMERHGGAHMMDRAFEGFAALPAPGAQERRPWREVLMIQADDDQWVAKSLPAGELIRAEMAYRHLAKKRHPDSGGSADAMAELNGAIAEARKELGG